MMKRNKLIFGISIIAGLVSCESKTNNNTISKSEMISVVTKLDKQFSDGIKAGDSAKLAGIYSDSAQYVQPKRTILTGRSEIGKEWADFLRLKEHPVDLILNIKDVRGTKEIIYETGDGYTLLQNSTKWNFNYVNVWRLQTDSTYKLEIDTYN